MLAYDCAAEKMSSAVRCEGQGAIPSQTSSGRLRTIAPSHPHASHQMSIQLSGERTQDNKNRVHTLARRRIRLGEEPESKSKTQQPSASVSRNPRPSLARGVPETRSSHRMEGHTGLPGSVPANSLMPPSPAIIPVVPSGDVSILNPMDSESIQKAGEVEKVSALMG